MNPLTTDTVIALAAVHLRLPDILVKLIAGNLTPHEQHDFGSALAEAADLIREHADDQARGIVQLQPADAVRALADVVTFGVRP
ncbi:hypothetical protein [Amycolatopsis jejuensis]|uniref:hypothetical protein n=1 Tax=Amycolatopsis jejuensis TaxID=330084 RepID=UPI000527E3AE|nr:hypothetical protein [Amycolatopsis jejuensis]